MIILKDIMRVYWQEKNGKITCRKKNKRKKRKNEIAKRKRQYLKTYCFIESCEVKQLKKELNSYEKAARFADSLATAFNITNEMFGYSERKEVNPALKNKIDSLREKLGIAEQKLKEK